MKKITKEKGITLIALVITIIVLLILAGISIAMLTGDNGILKKATTAKEQTSLASAEEKVKIAVAGSLGTNGKINIDDLNINLEDVEGIDKSGLPIAEIPTTVVVDGYTFLIELTGKIINVEDYYKKTGFEAEDIAKKPTEFYGAIVDNYTVNANATEAVKNAVTTWRIFYAGKEPNGTEENIYLIADDYINGSAAPNGQGGTEITKNTDYSLSFNNIYNDYNGGKFIWEKSLGKNWISQYLNYTTDEGTTYPNREESENINIKAVAYMMDTNVWNVYAGKNAKYAMGGPTLEMFVNSYKNTHTDKNIRCYMYNATGYTWENANDLLSDYNNIYVKPETEKAYNMLLASPDYYTTYNIVDVNCQGHLGNPRLYIY